MEENWRDYQKLVLGDLRRISQEIGVVQKDLHRLSLDVAQLKIKAGLFGGVIGGMASALLVAFVEFWVRH